MDRKDAILIVDKPFHSAKIPSDIKDLGRIPSIPGSVLEDGRINIECPCLQSQLAHRCGFLLREGIRCTNESEAKPRGADCIEFFMEHDLCLRKYDNTRETQ